MNTVTVKCLTEAQKDAAVAYYKSNVLNLKEIAQCFGTSPRTISRVLQERGLATPVPRLKGEAYQAVQLMKEYDLSIPGLKTVLHAYFHTPKQQDAQQAACVQ
jgi:AraC-like DNA-binding protein